MVPMKPTTHKRKIGDIPYLAGGRQTIDIDRDGILNGLLLRLKFGITTGATAPIGPFMNALARVLRRVEVVVNGRDTPINVEPFLLVAREYFERGVMPYGMTINNGNLVLTATTTTYYDIVIPINFNMPGRWLSQRIDDTALDTRGLGQLTLAVTWGVIADLFGTPGATVAFAANPALSVEGRYLINPDDKAVYLMRAIDQQERPLTGSMTQFDQILDRGSGIVYRTLLIATLQDSVAVDTVLQPVVSNYAAGQGILVQAGSFIWQNRDATVLRAENVREMQLPAVQAGCYYLNLTTEGSLVTGLDTSGLDADLKLTVDATYASGTTLVKIQREAVRPLKLR